MEQSKSATAAVCDLASAEEMKEFTEAPVVAVDVEDEE